MSVSSSKRIVRGSKRNQPINQLSKGYKLMAKNESNTPAVKMLSLKAVAASLNKDEHYIRQILRNGKLAGVKEVMDNGKTERWVVAEPVVEAWRAKQAEHAPIAREDGRRKWNMYRTPEEMEHLMTLDPSLREDGMVRLANPAKSSSDNE